ncbi:MAG: sigma-70 factor domain-containing protein, partial [Planctomycetota bacterium]
MPKTIRTAARRKTARRKPNCQPVRTRPGPHGTTEAVPEDFPEESPIEEAHPGHEFSDEYDVAHTGEDDQIEDPVRIYLMQMGEIPLLTRPEEVSAAKRIARSRRRFRYGLLATDYVLHAAVELLQRIRDGKLRLDRT